LILRSELLFKLCRIFRGSAVYKILSLATASSTPSLSEWTTFTEILRSNYTWVMLATI